MNSTSNFIVALLCASTFLTAFTIKKEAPVRHVVVFKYKATATPSEMQQVTDAIRALKNKIPGILSFEHGANMSPEKKDLGFNHVYLITFKDVASRDAYLPHPDHVKFVELLGKLSVLEDVFVVDFQVEK